MPVPALQEGSSYSHDGGKPLYFPHALVPTLEEKVKVQHQPPTGLANGMINEENVEREEHKTVVSAAPVATKVENGHLSADAPLASKTYGPPPHTRMGKNDNGVHEQKAQRTRHLMRKYPNANLGQSPRTVPTQKPEFDADSFEDPLCDEFWEDIWVASAMHNVGVYRFLGIKALTNRQMPLQTEIFRRVFRVVPDDLVTTWKHYKDFVAYHERILKPVRDSFLFRLFIVEHKLFISSKMISCLSLSGECLVHGEWNVH